MNARAGRCDGGILSVLLGLKARPRRIEIGVILSIAAVYLLLFVRVLTLVERSHVIEYGVLAAFVHEALMERAGGKRLFLPAGSALVITTFAVVLAALLIFTGTGAWAAEKFGIPENPRRSLRVIVPLILLTLALTTFLMPLVFDLALGWSLAARVFVSILLLAPLGILLCMPFPTGLRIIGAEAAALVP